MWALPVPYFCGITLIIKVATGNYYVDRVSGYFIPPNTDSYVFYVASDDDSDLFLSSDSTAENKKMIAQSTAWTNPDNWLYMDANGVIGADAAGRNWAQAASETFQDPVTCFTPFASGIPLTAGNLYYIEGVHSHDGGGDGFTVTYQTATMMGGNIAAPSALWSANFTNGTPSLLYATNNNIAYISSPDTTPTWTLQPSNTTFTANLSGTLYAHALSGGEFAPTYQWYSNSAVIAGATSSSYYLDSWPVSGNGASFTCVATSPMSGLTSTSDAAIIKIREPVFQKGWALCSYWYAAEPTLGQLEQETLGTPADVIAYSELRRKHQQRRLRR